MKIEILHYIEGAKKAHGIAVIIDVFRAFSVECYATANNVDKIIPVASKELAYELKSNNPDYILVGERGGIKLPGFDYGNSPSELEHVDLTGKVMVHTTSAGTQGLENARNADEIITGSLVNARAIAEYIRAHDFEHVSLVAMGNEGCREAKEDNLCAEYLKALLEGHTPDITQQIESLKTAGGEHFFDGYRPDAFPQRDFFLCTELNKFDFVLKFQYDSSGLGYITNEKL